MNSLALAGLLLGFQGFLARHRGGLDLAARVSAVDYRPVAMRLADQNEARIAGAWRVTSPDSRLGGLSGLAFDGGRLVALSDAGMVAWLDLPDSAGPRAALLALPAVAGDPRTKIGRDSEALARDPGGRGWWVAFEQRHSLLLFDDGFTRLIERHPLNLPGASRNRGIEALFDGGNGRLVALREDSGVSDAVRLRDGRVARIERRIGPGGITSAIRVGAVHFALPLGPTDNPEGIAAAPLPGGGTRLWVVTDNDFLKWRATLLIAIDLTPGN